MSTMTVTNGIGQTEYLEVSGEGTLISPYRTAHDISRTELGYDAWGRNKVYMDKSLFSGLFTYDVPVKMWKELNWNGADFIEQASFSKATSVDGALRFTSGTTLNALTQLRAKEHVRYQPNRGHLYSTSMFLDNPTARGIRRFGKILPCNGVFFELTGDGADWDLWFVVRNHFVDTRINIKSEMTADFLNTFDPSKGNLYDFQMQWRGVGDFKIYINQEFIYSTSVLGTRDIVSTENPSLPVGYETQNLGDEVTMRVGCVDISSEGGEELRAKYASVTSGTSLPSVVNTGTAVLAVRMPYKISYGGDDVCYTRDVVLNQISAFCKDESFVNVYYSRAVHLTALPNETWTRANGGFIEHMVGGNGSALDVAFQTDKANMELLTSIRQEKDFIVRTVNPAPVLAPFTLTANDYLVVELKPDAASTGGVTIEMAEQI